MDRWASKWGIPGPGSSADWFRGYVRAALAAGGAGGPVSGARVMWGSMEGIVEGLQPTRRDRSGNAPTVLQQSFGSVRFVWLRRLDAVAQAISRYRAERSNVWHLTGEPTSIAEPEAGKFDFDAIHAFVAEAHDHDREWASWFEREGVKPLIVTYEDLTRDADLQVDRILTFLEVDRSQRRPAQSANRRMADELSAEWAARYRTELQRRG